MKKIQFAAAILFVFSMLIACTYAPNQVLGIYNYSDEIDAPNYDDDFHGVRSHWQGLRMYVAADSVTPTGLRLSMINQYELNFGHGTPFRVEQYLDSGWEEVPITGNAVWVMPLLRVPPNTTVDENISWEHMYGHLQPGLYRIVRNFIEHDLFDPTPMWELDIPEVYLYAVFTIEQDWQAAHDKWQSEQDDLADVAFARFEGLDLEILEYSPRGLSFTLTNNNPYYSYIILGAFIGWEDIFPDGGFAGSVEYFIFSQGFLSESWPFGDEKRLHPGEYLFLEVDWYSEIGYLAPRRGRHLAVDVMLDVDEEYINENFRHIMPRQLRLPGIGHRIYASFEILP